MPHGNDDLNVNNYSSHLLVVERLITNNSDYHSVIGGDFNVDFSRIRVHTSLLRSFSDDLDLHNSAS
jgi:hypothetical protein